MKSLFILLTVVSSFFTNTTKANEGNVSDAAIQSFNRTFSGASEVSWSFENNLYKASFQVSGQYASAFYDEHGDLLVITRNISPLQLPVVLLASIKQQHGHKWVSELVEVSNNNGTYYYVTLEDAGQKIILKSDGTARWMKYQKTEK